MDYDSTRFVVINSIGNYSGGFMKSEMQQEEWVPDPRVRKSVEGIITEGVTSLVFFGHSFGYPWVPNIHVTDQQMISQIVSALKHARLASSSGLWLAPLKLGDELTIEWAPTQHVLQEVVVLKFDATRNPFCPEFVQALKGLGEYQAKQVRQQIEDSYSVVKSIDLHYCNITDADEVHLFLDGLGQLDSRAFDFTKPETSAWLIDIRCQDDNTLTLCLIIDVNRISEAGGNSIPPLPDILWGYYTRQ